MNRFLLLILTLATLVACNNNADDKQEANIPKPDTASTRVIETNDTTDDIPRFEVATNRDSSIANDFKSYKIYPLTDTIKNDFNGDKIADLAYLTHNDNGEMFIIDGKTQKATKIGHHKSFGSIGTQFNWANVWGTTNDPETFEILIKDGEIIGDTKTKLNNTSLFIRKDEVGGGVITYKNGEYIWVHQAD